MKRADGVLFVCEKDNKKSITNLFMWKNLIDDNCNKSIPMVVVMNKMDKKSEIEDKGDKITNIRKNTSNHSYLS